jgi:hypothetical protein
MDLSIAFERIVALLTDITFVPVAVGLVLVITQILKSVFKWEGSRAAVAALGVQVVVWVVYAILKSRGMDAQFEQWSKALEGILTALASVLFPAIVSGLATQNVYERVTEKEVPGFRGKSA